MNIRYFAGRTILITGASAGIGYEFARQLAPAVSTMLLVARRNERLEALESELKAINPKVQLFSRSRGISRAIEHVEDEQQIQVDIAQVGVGLHARYSYRE